MPPEQFEFEFASPEDRGDNIPVAATQANAPAVKMEEPPKLDEPRTEDPPRDEGGKFAKKERQFQQEAEIRQQQASQDAEIKQKDAIARRAQGFKQDAQQPTGDK